MTGNDKWRIRRQINRTFALVILTNIKMLQFEGNNNDKIDLYQFGNGIFNCVFECGCQVRKVGI
jgi:hypothetical protein